MAFTFTVQNLLAIFLKTAIQLKKQNHVKEYGHKDWVPVTARDHSIPLEGISYRPKELKIPGHLILLSQQTWCYNTCNWRIGLSYRTGTARSEKLNQVEELRAVGGTIDYIMQQYEIRNFLLVWSKGTWKIDRRSIGTSM